MLGLEQEIKDRLRTTLLCVIGLGAIYFASDYVQQIHNEILDNCRYNVEVLENDKEKANTL